MKKGRACAILCQYHIFYVLIFLSVAFGSCSKESPEDQDTYSGDNDVTLHPPTRSHVATDELKQHRDGWREAFRGGSSGGGDLYRGLGVLEQAEEDLRAGDFAHLAEKLYDGARSDAEVEALLGQLARLACGNGLRRLPSWFRLIEVKEIRMAVVGAMGAEFARQEKSDAASRADVFATEEEKIVFMVGYACEIVRNDPVAAFDTYLAWAMARDPKAMESLPEVINVMTAETDFAKLDGKIPRTEQHIAVAAREALYARWADVDTVGMVNHLVTNNLMGSSLVTALKKWHAKDPAGTEDWMQKVVTSGTGNPAWDSVHAAKAQMFFQKRDYPTAWENMMKIEDFTTKRKIQATIFNAWVKADPKALMRAQREFAMENKEELDKWEREINKGR